MSATSVLSSGRKNYIDFAKGVTILSVVIGHLVPYSGRLFRLIFAFHMPFFFLLQGFMQNEKLPGFTEFVIKKAKRLLVPTWIYRIVNNIAIPMILEGSVFSAKDILIKVFWNSTLEWFLPVLFWVNIGMYFYIYLRNKTDNDKVFALFSGILIAVLSLFSSLYLHNDTIYTPFKLGSGALAMAFSIIGYWIKKYDIVNVCSDAYNAVPRKYMRYAILAGILVIYAFLAKYNSTITVNLASNSVGNNAVAYFTVGSMMFILLIAIGKNVKNEYSCVLRWLYLCGRHSMLIYLGHMMIHKGITRAIQFLTNGQLDLQPMINLNPAWIMVFFIITMLLLTGICLVGETIKPHRVK